MSESTASVTVKLPRPMTGLKLMAAVQKVTERDRMVKFISLDEKDGYLIGQTSGYDYECLLIAPSMNNHYIQTNATYSQVVVMNYPEWPGMRLLLLTADGAEEQVITEFCAAFNRHLRS